MRTEPAGTAALPRRPRADYRPELQGLRAVAVLLVVVYHIWLGRVSGGVDVFLMLTGFLITGSLLRAVEREGRVRIAAFGARLARRLFPPAALVLGGVLVGMSPRLRFDPAECVEEYGRDAACVEDRYHSFAKATTEEMLPDIPPNATVVDLSRYMCPDRGCPSVIGNVLVYRDKYHLTATYARTLAPMLETELRKAVLT